MSWIFAVATLVAIQRVSELIYARRNTAALLARGGIEVGAGHYPLFILLHGAWLVSLVALVPSDQTPAWPWLALFILLQLCRLWIIGSLGPYWTTRIVTLADAPLLRRGPYRLMRHPNYAVTAGEIAVLPLAFGAWRIALVFSVLNTALLAWRIRVEERALAPRRRSAAPS
ncbi:MAG TPA: isoprenylcysteine carboxylmethyltransferase family protein [Stellaceae bacterium]|nr:isoprenylcysteine carboxylmethyltransferase family protein [Stellaceae bacterium]